MIADTVVMIKGAGDIASGVALRLWRCGFRVVMTELERPLAIRRTVAFSDAMYDGEARVEDALARRTEDATGVLACWQQGEIALLTDPSGALRAQLQPHVFVDATIAKRNLGTTLQHAALVIALGPGFEAGRDAHAVIETMRGHDLGRVLWRGTAAPDTGAPGAIAGITHDRVIHAPVSGRLHPLAEIGSHVEAGMMIASIDDTPVQSKIRGVLRGLLHPRTPVSAGMKIADVDPRGEVSNCWTVSDKALALAGGVLEAILAHSKQNSPQGHR